MHHARASKSQWQSRRNMSLGPPVRRAHPASGATWNVQVVRGKMTSRCLWHACRALILGMVLMLLGAGMATIGYYAEHLSVGQEIRGNATVRVKNESRGFHLNNLSYVGPIVMGFGGFIVVAACVMTFEARDSAAKVVPARFKVSTTSRTPRTNSTSRRTTGTSTQTAPQQASRWDARLGVFRTLPSTTAGMAVAAAALATDAGASNASERKALTAALVHFSRALGKPRSPKLDTPPKSPHDPSRRFSRSDSVPNLTAQLLPSPRSADASSGTSGTSATIQHQATMTSGDRSPPAGVRYQKAMAGARHRCHRKSSMLQRSSLSGERSTTSPVFLHPGMGASGGGGRHQHQWRQRHAMTVDESGPGLYYRSGSRPGEAFELGVLQTTAAPGHGGPLAAMATGGGVSAATCRLRDRNQRSDTARRHVLSRQKPIEKDEPHQATARTKGSSSKQLRPTPSVELTNVFRSQRARGAMAALAARTPSLDSRAVQTDAVPVIGVAAGGGRVAHFGRSESARRLVGREWSTPSDERESRSEFSVKSEPGAVRSLSGQSSSLEPCVESAADDQRPANGDILPAASSVPTPTPASLPTIIDPTDSSEPAKPALVVLTASPASPTATAPSAARRPDSLILSCSAAAAASSRSPAPMPGATPKPAIERPESPSERPSPSRHAAVDRQHKFLYRSNSSRLYNRPRPKVQLSKEFDQIYFIGSNKEDEYYDSIDVIDERRSRSNFRRSASSSGAARGAGADGAGGVGATGFAATAAFCRSSTVIYNEYCGADEATAAKAATSTAMEEAEVSNAASAVPSKVTTTDAAQPAVGSEPAIKGVVVTESKALPVGNVVLPEPTQFGPHPAAARSPKTSSMDEIEVMKDDGDEDETATPALAVVLNLGDTTGGVGIVASNGVVVAVPVAEAEGDSDGDGDGRDGVVGGRCGATPTTPTTITVRADIEDCGRRSE